MSLRNQIAVVVGTRPEIIKVAILVRLLGADASLIHSGQHYDERLSGAVRAGYRLPEPVIELTGVGGATRSTQIGNIVRALGDAFTADPPAVVIVQGDTNTAVAAAQAAHYCGIPLLHVEAGLRAHDRELPEEINRRLISVLADRHAAPTPQAAANLRREGTDPARIHITGNTIIEAVLESLPSPTCRASILNRYGLQANGYVLATIHRPENTDSPGQLGAILNELAKLPLPVVFPAHPRTVGAAARLGLSAALDRLSPIPPVDHPTLLALGMEARLLISDSGGLQEEATVLKRPLLVVRRTTERPEAVNTGFAQLVAAGPAIGIATRKLLADGQTPERLAAIPSPYGDGRASTRIAALARSLPDERRGTQTI